MVVGRLPRGDRGARRRGACRRASPRAVRSGHDARGGLRRRLRPDAPAAPRRRLLRHGARVRGGGDGRQILAGGGRAVDLRAGVGPGDGLPVGAIGGDVRGRSGGGRGHGLLVDSGNAGSVGRGGGGGVGGTQGQAGGGMCQAFSGIQRSEEGAGQGGQRPHGTGGAPVLPEAVGEGCEGGRGPHRHGELQRSAGRAHGEQRTLS
mmetsp:Transcript_25193/g.50114  ORF Transcript_25193/g.50114 Transcript_25193/m.50114 type:complete len:205 (-) Transcript_25193:222-836(-)